MKIINVEEAIGTVLCHDITRIIPGQSKGPGFRRGHVVREEDVSELRKIGKEHLYVFDLADGYVHEDDAARRIARAAAGPRRGAGRAGGGQGDLHRRRGREDRHRRHASAQAQFPGRRPVRHHSRQPARAKGEKTGRCQGASPGGSRRIGHRRRAAARGRKTHGPGPAAETGQGGNRGHRQRGLQGADRGQIRPGGQGKIQKLRLHGPGQTPGFRRRDDDREGHSRFPERGSGFHRGSRAACPWTPTTGLRPPSVPPGPK